MPDEPLTASTPHRVVYLFRRGRAARLDALERGEGPDEMLYGLTHLDPARYAASFVEGDDTRWTWRRALCYPSELWIARTVGRGFAFHVVWQHLAALRRADVVLATIDAVGLPLLWMKRLGLVKAPVLYLSQGLSDRFENLGARSPLYRGLWRFYRRLLARADRVLVLGAGAVQPMRNAFGLGADRVHCAPFGIDAAFWSECHPDSGCTPEWHSGVAPILSVGSDPARDYDTLLRAVGDHRLLIVTRLPLPLERMGDHVETGTRYTDLELRDLYRGARFVVCPLHDVAQPSGQSATLQAMACGKAVILSAIRGLWEPERLRHLENCMLVPPGDVEAMREAIEYLVARPDEAARLGRNARETVAAHCDSAAFARRLERHMDEILGHVPPSGEG